MEAIIASVIVFAVTAAGAFLVNKAKQQQLHDAKKNLKILAEHELELRKKIEEMELKQDDLLVKKTSAETKLSSLEQQLVKLENERNLVAKEREAAIEARNEELRQKELMQQRIASIREEMENWQKTKEQHIDIAKASIMEAGAKLSNKLLDDHKREMEAAKKESEKTVKDTTEELHKKFQNVFESMNTLNDRVNKSSDTVDLVRRSLLSPSGAGSLAEITLENIFKASGLIENQDYRMQHSIAASEDSGALRPDAVVFLPANNVLVVDSKASKFFVEIGHAEENSAEQKELGESLKASMNKHLKDLVKRDYKEALEKQLAGITDSVFVNATTLMFLPSDAALEKLRAVDANFMDKAWKERIIPVGPSGLVSILINATLLISNAKQEENTQKIINEVKELLGSVAKIYELAGGVGKGLNGAVKKYDDFAASFNRNFLSKAKKLDKLGVSAPKIKEAKPLERYTIDNREYKQIDGEAEEEMLALEEAA